MTTPDAFIDSFGARWQDAPPPRYRAAVLDINLTNQLLNPPDDPALADIVARQTGQDTGVRDYVLGTPGAARIIADAVHELTALHTAANSRPVQLLVNCWYGRHRVVDRTTRGHERERIPAWPAETAGSERSKDFRSASMPRWPNSTASSGVRSMVGRSWSTLACQASPKWHRRLNRKRADPGLTADPSCTTDTTGPAQGGAALNEGL
ncbi:RapZ C-terminal domain-containing protein [Streptomyces mirabilis]|uniref:RapZ C-terminal domain-containing protein n=1 Tax=Streptomyces mirabilis TaxID=68239 RepID=UPI0036DAA746